MSIITPAALPTPTATAPVQRRPEAFAVAALIAVALAALVALALALPANTVPHLGLRAHEPNAAAASFAAPRSR